MIASRFISRQQCFQLLLKKVAKKEANLKPKLETLLPLIDRKTWIFRLGQICCMYLYFRVMGLLHLLFLGEVIKEFIMWSTTRFFIMYLCSVDLAISLLILRAIKHDVHLLQNSYISAIVVRYVLLRVFIMDLYLVKRKLLRYKETKSFLL